ncbi:MAG: DNA-3-methyladenine glycosylase I [Bacteroidetes bacterium]|nr:DNA-3-methyladenine glycosylase I [Bacteroidota bacterium]
MSHPAPSDIPRCPWCGTDPLYVRYHDEEWGRRVHDDRQLFEMLTLEGAQAGLSWITVLRKREGYREAFHGFDPQRVAVMTEEEQQHLLTHPGIVRNRLKVASTITNARAFLDLQREHGSFAAWYWSFTGGEPIRNVRRTMRDLPASTPLAEQISKEMKRRGFRFVGPTIIYAFMQATGMVNDHLTTCFRYSEEG